MVAFTFRDPGDDTDIEVECPRLGTAAPSYATDSG